MLSHEFSWQAWKASHDKNISCISRIPTCDCYTVGPLPVIIGLLRGGLPGGGGSLIFPKVPQSSLGILRVPQLPPPPLNTPPLRNPTKLQLGLKNSIDRCCYPSYRMKKPTRPGVSGQVDGNAWWIIQLGTYQWHGEWTCIAGCF